MSASTAKPVAQHRELTFANQQRTKRLNTLLLKTITEATLSELCVTDCHLTFYLVGAKKMADINEGHLQHDGPTDVITFNYAGDGARKTSPTLHGEILICIDVAVAQAREFRTTWQSEVVRYVVHSLLHLCGYDDLKPADRREMKRHENRLVRTLSRRFKFSSISRP
ncbi:MAG: hypothetical protein RLY20_2755 [Verrucomicrobiota bacterium]|jgi:probable rRNA maturation factor